MVNSFLLDGSKQHIIGMPPLQKQNASKGLLDHEGLNHYSQPCPLEGKDGALGGIHSPCFGRS